MKKFWEKFLNVLFDCIVKFAKFICKIFSTNIGSYVFFFVSIILSMIFVIFIYIIKTIFMFIGTIFITTKELFSGVVNIFKYGINYSAIRTREKFKEEYKFFKDIDDDADMISVIEKLNKNMKDISSPKE